MAGIILVDAEELLQPKNSVQIAAPAERNLSLVDLGKKLLDAARQGETEEVRALMTNGAPFTADWLGTSPLHMAAQNGHLSTAEVLIRAGISRDARTKVDRTPLHVAAQEGHLEIVELLLKHGADVDAKDMLKMTPLHWAVERGHVDVIQVLLEYCADVNSLSKFDKTPISVALDNGRIDIAQLLTMNGQGKKRIDEGTDTDTLVLKAEDVEEEDDEVGEDFVNASLDAMEEVETVTSHRRRAKIELKHEETDDATATLQWLEQHGITMMPTENSTIIASAIESGQSIHLTEAGKMALNWTKKTSPQRSSKSIANQKVITIVTDQSQIPSIVTEAAGNSIIVTDSDSLISLDKDFREPPIKKLKRNDERTELVDECISLSHQELARKLEEAERKAREYKLQLRKTEQEAAKLKRELESRSASGALSPSKK